MTMDRRSAELDEVLPRGIDSMTINEVEKVDPELGLTAMARELTELSMKDREELLSDLHGVASVIKETPDLIEKSLKSLEQELQNLPQKAAYRKALALAPEHVLDKKLRLMFLRASRFEIMGAAKMMTDYFEQKRRVFGEAKLTSDIGIQDLDEESLKCLETGYVQILPGKDRSGRGILAGIAKLRKPSTELGLMRSFWYMAMSALEDEQTQKRGIVFLSYAVDSSVLDRSGIFQLASIFRALPMRIVGIHVCVDDRRMQMVAELGALLMASRHRIRLRCHCGTDLECQYKLMTFGIPDSILPLSATGNVENVVHLEWLEKRKKLEAVSQRAGSPHVVVEPGEWDVLLGRGKMIQEHQGNQNYRILIEEYRARYENALKVEKTYIAKEVVQVVKNHGGRFLKQKNDEWIEVTTDVARDKVSHSFRNRRTAPASSSPVWKEPYQGPSAVHQLASRFAGPFVASLEGTTWSSADSSRDSHGFSFTQL